MENVMYYPYFRGKQYDLLAIKECARTMGIANFIPIIEPVKSSMGAITRTLNELKENSCKHIIVTNPTVGDFSYNVDMTILDFLILNYSDNDFLQIGIILDDKISDDEISSILERSPFNHVSLIHKGYNKAANLLALLSKHNEKEYCHIFLKNDKLYRKHFKSFPRVLIQDNFEKRANKSHPDTEFFSDLHILYEEEGLNGFGDYLIVGEDYSETGGPAYAVAIHITYVDTDNEEKMYVHHFKSDRSDTPTDPGGKFAEALEKLIRDLESPKTKILQTTAIEEFKQLYNKKHFPGLGVVKKISMKHHIEVLANYFNKSLDSK